MAKSLVDLCLAVCVRNYRDIYDVGDLKYDLVRPIIQKIDNAHQLRELEVSSPQLLEHTADTWKRLIARDFPLLGERNKFVPSNPHSWHKIYAKYLRIDTTQKREAEAKLVNAFKEIKKEKDGNVSQVVNYHNKKLPRDGRPRINIRPARKRLGADGSKNLLSMARREARDISSRNRLNAQTGAAQVKQGQVARAPAGMVHDQVTNARPLTGVRPPSTQLPVGARSRQLKINETRLLRIQEMDTSKEVSYISDEDLEDSDIMSDDDPGGLTVEDLEGSFARPGTPHKAKSPGVGTGSSSAGGSRFARKMGSMTGSPAAASASRVHVEPQPKPKSPQPQKTPTKANVAQTSGKTNAPLRHPPNTPSPLPGSGLVPRKRKPVDIFMKPKPKGPRS